MLNYFVDLLFFVCSFCLFVFFLHLHTLNICKSNLCAKVSRLSAAAGLLHSVFLHHCCSSSGCTRWFWTSEALRVQPSAPPRSLTAGLEDLQQAEQRPADPERRRWRRLRTEEESG